MSGSTGRYSKVTLESDPESLSEAQTAATFRPGVRVPWVFVTTLITALASVVGTYYATHATPIDCASKGDVNALDLRIGKQAEDIRALTATVNANAQQSHNDIAIMNGTLLTLSRIK